MYNLPQPKSKLLPFEDINVSKTLKISNLTENFRRSDGKRRRSILYFCSIKFAFIILLWIIAVLFALIDMPYDAAALALLALPFTLFPKTSLIVFCLIMLINLIPEHHLNNFQNNELGEPGAVSVVTFNYQLMLNERPIYPGLVGFFGWNYEAAVALEGLKELAKLSTPQNNTIVVSITQVLEDSLYFPHTGRFMSLGLPTFWLYSCGDRIGLYGSQYKEINKRVYETSIRGTIQWPSLVDTELKLRNIGYKFPSFRKRFIWVDDVYMAGAALLQSEQGINITRKMLISTVQLVRDEETGLFFHGIEVDRRHESVGIRILSNNKIKWGRANAWILLTFARYLHHQPNDNEISRLLEEIIYSVTKFQRDTGAFGNVIDVSDSVDETSLTSIYIYAVAVFTNITSIEDYVSQAILAYHWLNTRQVEGISMSDTCGAAPLGTDISQYESRVKGLQKGPAIGFILWANVGAKMLGID